MMNMPMWYYDKVDLKTTPSALDGIDVLVEARFRKQGARFIINTGTKMGLRYDTMATGVVYFHRFYMFHSFKVFPRYVTACCCLFLAGKVEETPKKCKDIIKNARSLLNDHQFAQFGEDPKEEVMTLERILLQTIKFDLQVDHPYSYLLKYAKCLKGDKQKLQKMVQMAWTFVNDSLCTSLCLQWEPEVIAIALMYLAGKLSKFEVNDWVGRIPKHERWWDVFVDDISKDLLEDICHQVLDLYSSTPGTAGSRIESSPGTPPTPVTAPTSAAPAMAAQPATAAALPQPAASVPLAATKSRTSSPSQPLAAIPVQVAKKEQISTSISKSVSKKPEGHTKHRDPQSHPAAQHIPTVTETHSTAPPPPPPPIHPVAATPTTVPSVVASIPAPVIHAQPAQTAAAAAAAAAYCPPTATDAYAQYTHPATTVAPAVQYQPASSYPPATYADASQPPPPVYTDPGQYTQAPQQHYASGYGDGQSYSYPPQQQSYYQPNPVTQQTAAYQQHHPQPHADPHQPQHHSQPAPPPPQYQAPTQYAAAQPLPYAHHQAHPQHPMEGYPPPREGQAYPSHLHEGYHQPPHEGYRQPIHEGYHAPHEGYHQPQHDSYHQQSAGYPPHPQQTYPPGMPGVNNPMYMGGHPARPSWPM